MKCLKKKEEKHTDAFSLLCSDCNLLYNLIWAHQLYLTLKFQFSQYAFVFKWEN